MKIEDAKVRYVEKEAPSPRKSGRVSIYLEDYKGEYYNLPVEKLFPFKSQARKFFDQESIDALATTIKDHGIRQPLTVLPAEGQEGYYEIVSGERRYRAALQLGLKTVPCLIFHDRDKAEEVALIENIQRKDLHPIELMNAYSHLLDKGICTSLQGVADKLGLSKASVVDIMNLKNLPIETQELLLTHQIKSRDFLRILCKAPAENHVALIARYETKESGDKKAKKKVINTKTKVLNIVYDNDMFIIENNRVKDLSTKQKEEVKNLIIHILDSL
jgi:ParB family chromosome partitioning protein